MEEGGIVVEEDMFVETLADKPSVEHFHLLDAEKARFLLESGFWSSRIRFVSPEEMMRLWDPVGTLRLR